MKLELWTSIHTTPQHVADYARRAEQAGWDGVVVYDSQNLNGDCYVALTLAATATRRIGLGPGVTNPATRHPAVTAGAIASIQRVSDGRAVLGIGRGDSALAFIGRSPSRVAALERYLRALQTYLGGGGVAFGDLDFDETMAPRASPLGLADAPSESTLTWLDPADPKVPVEVAATGPKVIAAAARHADSVALALGADPERLSWGMEQARRARREAGLDPDAMAFAAYVNLVCHPDAHTAGTLAAQGLATFARFSAMHGTVSGPLPDHERRLLGDVNRGFNMREHERNAGLVPSVLADRFAVLGAPDVCIRRLEAIAAIGIEKVIVVGPRDESGDPEAQRVEELVARHVLPAFAD